MNIRYPVPGGALRGGDGTGAAKNSIAFLGDSITANGGMLDPAPGSTASQYINEQAWGPLANYLAGCPFGLVVPGPTDPGSIAQGSTGVGFALVGITTDAIISGGYLAAAAASAASVVVVELGTNNINRGDTAASIMADLLTIWTTLTGAGKTVVATTILPRDSTVVIGPLLVQQLTLNTLIRETAEATPGVVLCDWNPVLLDASGNAPAPGASIWYLDGTHPNSAGAGRLAAYLAPVLKALVPPQPSADWLPNNAADVLTPNPYALGNVSGVATSWTVNTIGTPTVRTASMVARTDLIPGQWQQVACTAATANADGWNITISDTTPATWRPGQSVFAACEIQADAAGWDCRGLQLDVVMTGVAQTANANFIASSGRLALTTAIMPAPTSNLVLVTPRIVIPATGVTAVRAVLRFYGSGTVRVARIGTRIAV